MTKTIYLAGGCYWGTEKYISNIKGVIETEVGFANGNTEAPSYQQVKHENTGHAETVRIVYDPEVVPLQALLRLFFLIIDPTSIDRQGEDVGHQYRTGIYFTDEKDGEIAALALKNLEQEIGAPVAVECCPLEQFWPAEEYHQKYLDKNPGGYCHVSPGKIRWVKDVNPLDYVGGGF
jgi:methionine-S-sulfoxide reductase